MREGAGTAGGEFVATSKSTVGAELKLLMRTKTPPRSTITARTPPTIKTGAWLFFFAGRCHGGGDVGCGDIGGCDCGCGGAAAAVRDGDGAAWLPAACRAAVGTWFVQEPLAGGGAGGVGAIGGTEGVALAPR